jgi:putative sigma-54 modulation protein
MKVSYTGVKQKLPEKLQAKLDAKFAKLSKLLEQRGEREAHVVVTHERHLHQAEITVQFYDHKLLGIGTDGDLFTAVTTALDKLEKQAVKQRAKWRDTKRRKEAPKVMPQPGGVAPPAGVDGRASQRVFRVSQQTRRKPMTLEEAMIEMEKDRDYLVYRDADRETVSVLVRRRDGHFDLIEA